MAHFFLSNREKDQNMPLKNSSEKKIGCQECKGGRIGSQLIIISSMDHTWMESIPLLGFPHLGSL